MYVDLLASVRDCEDTKSNVNVIVLCSWPGNSATESVPLNWEAYDFLETMTVQFCMGLEFLRFLLRSIPWSSLSAWSSRANVPPNVLKMHTRRIHLQSMRLQVASNWTQIELNLCLALRLETLNLVTVFRDWTLDCCLHKVEPSTRWGEMHIFASTCSGLRIRWAVSYWPHVVAWTLKDFVSTSVRCCIADIAQGWVLE